ncbi:MAG: hypothetical protein M3Y91_17680 [Actinomycetota bacterium]|nr:hypothetical protein [Actinomycetota bacterium]
MLRWPRPLLRWPRPRHQVRLSGSPPSPNGASSFHLWWQLPSAGVVTEVSAVVEIVTAPAVDSLYFWALQVGFAQEGRSVGAGHTGLQWHPGARGGAVNWGGYEEAGGELSGTRSVLPEVDSPNTVVWPWQPGRPYRFTVSRGTPGSWRSEVTDLVDGRQVTLRELAIGASELTSPAVWTETFARCDDPPVSARWSQLRARRADGSTLSPSSLVSTYQSVADGGCSNTESRADGAAVVQTTGLPGPRSGHDGQILPYGDGLARTPPA